jgi:hypothetical protein
MTYCHVPRLHLSDVESDSYPTSSRFCAKDIANSVEHRAKSRRWFRDLLWYAFPSDSENSLAEKAAPVVGVSERQIRNWLGCHNDAALSHVLAVLAVAGAEVIFTKIEGRK